MLWLLLRAQVSPAVVAGGAQREARSRDASCRAVSWSAQVQFLHQQKGLCPKTSSSEHMSDLHFEHPPDFATKGPNMAEASRENSSWPRRKEGVDLTKMKVEHRNT